MLLYAVIFALCAGAVAADEIGSIQVFMTPGEGRDKLFPEAAEFVREVRQLDAAAKVGLAAELGRGFADDSLDGIMINQVLHHLPDDADTGYPLHRQVFAEFARVLGPGGVLVINACSQDQINDAYWYYHLAPRARAAMAAGFAPLETFEALRADVGLTPRGRFVPVDAICQGDAYFHSRGPLEKPWRDGDSFWARADDGELATALAKVRDMDAAGTLDAFVAEHDGPRRHLGQITFVAASLD